MEAARLTARSMLSFGMLTVRAFWMASFRRLLDSGSTPPERAATVISRAILVKSWPRLASLAPFWRLIVRPFRVA